MTSPIACRPVARWSGKDVSGARLHVPCYCHVMLRGNQFATTAARAERNSIVADVIGRFDVRVHAFCWMTNHLHAVSQIAEHPLSLSA